MIYSKLAKKPKQFKSLVGFTVRRFDSLLAEVLKQYKITEQERLSSRVRVRQIGAGRPFKLPVRDRFLMLLVCRRWNASYDLLEQLFGIDATTVCRDLKKIEPAVKACMLIPEKADQVTKKVSTPEQLEKHLPGVLATIEIPSRV